MDTMPEVTVCPSCQAVIAATANFCSQCGRKLKNTSLSTSVGKQVFIYLVSFFLAPFGLGYAFMYLKQPDAKARMIGIVSLVLTACAIVAVISIATAFMKSYYGALDTLIF
ncbi:MAG: zinc ribbon domain-containing protein [Patescibacteria group bacterium]